MSRGRGDGRGRGNSHDRSPSPATSASPDGGCGRGRQHARNREMIRCTIPVDFPYLVQESLKVAKTAKEAKNSNRQRVSCIYNVAVVLHNFKCSYNIMFLFYTEHLLSCVEAINFSNL